MVSSLMQEILKQDALSYETKDIWVLSHCFEGRRVFSRLDMLQLCKTVGHYSMLGPQHNGCSEGWCVCGVKWARYSGFMNMSQPCFEHGGFLAESLFRSIGFFLAVSLSLSHG